MPEDSAVICGFYGRGNLGDEALLAGLLQSLSAATGSSRHVVLTPAPRAVASAHGVRAQHWDGAARGQRARSRRDARLVALLLRHRRFVLGGGDLLRDSPSQDVAQVWLRPARIALALRRQVAVVGVSVGEIHREDTRQLIRDTLNRCGVITVRDRSSRDRLVDLGVTEPVHVLPDLALSLTIPRPPVTEPTITVCLRSLADRADADATAAWTHALDALAQALRAFPDVRVRLVPLRSAAHSYRPVDDDHVTALEFLARTGLGPRVEVVRHVPDVPSLIEQLADSSVVVGMRLHSLVLAVGLDRPVIGLSYDTKVAGFLQEVGGQRSGRALGDVDAGWLAGLLRDVLERGDHGYDRELARTHAAGHDRLIELLRSW